MHRFARILIAGLLTGSIFLSFPACSQKDTDHPPQLSSGGYSQDGTYTPPMPDVSDALAAAQKVNNEVVAWLVLPNTEVNEAVVQTTNNDFYLRKDIEKKYAYEGCYYMDYESLMFDEGKNLARNTIIYGHNLGNPMGVKDDPTGVKFAQLFRLEEEQLAKQTPYVYLVTPAATHIFEIFAVSYCEAETSPIPYHYAEYSDKDFLTLVADMKARSLYTYDVSVSADDQILTLSTCSYKFGTYTQNPDQRFIVMGKLVKEGATFHETAALRINENPKQPSF
ncbi:MAG: class B sortase [Anaerotruncus sp.]|nr:class B sortase [Anaerotruncus sp.]